MTSLASDTINFEIRYAEDETRSGPGRLTGTLLTYETRAADRPEMFTRGALRWQSHGIIVDEQHNREAPILRALPYIDGDAVKIDQRVPDTVRGRDAVTNIREGVFRGLSVTFKAIQQEHRGGLRVIRQAFLGRAGLVDDPSYADSLVEVRAKLWPGVDLDPLRQKAMAMAWL